MMPKTLITKIIMRIYKKRQKVLWTKQFENDDKFQIVE